MKLISVLALALSAVVGIDIGKRHVRRARRS
jgi:hypothetical protein